MSNNHIGLGLFSRRAITFYVLILLTAVTVLALPSSGSASPLKNLTIHTEKPLGPVAGTFSTSGAFFDAGTFVTEQRIVSALPSPFGVVSHLVLLFTGEDGTFTIRTQIRETVTDDPNVFANDGTWVMVDGTGAYTGLRGQGELTGTVDDTTNLVTRDYSGQVLFPPSH